MSKKPGDWWNPDGDSVDCKKMTWKCLGKAILALTRRVAELEEYTARDADAIRDLEGDVRRLMARAGL